MQSAAVGAIEIALSIVGAFYAFAGVVAAQATVASRMMDQAISAIGGEGPTRTETVQSFWMIGAALVVLAGGSALMLRLELAAWLFAISAAGQALYLTILAPRYFDADNPPDPKGRQATLNAFVLYAAATAFVVWAALTGRLRSLNETPWWLTAIVAATVAAYAAHTLWNALRPWRSPQSAP